MGQRLHRQGCDVVVARSGREGWPRALCEKPFDLAQMDIQMPGMDGVEALRLFRKGPSDRFVFLTPSDTSVVAVKANALGGDEERFLDLGFNDYLSKPFRQIEQLGSLLQQSRRGQLGAHASAEVDSQTAAPGSAPHFDLDAPATAQVLPMAASNNLSHVPLLDPQAVKRLRELDPSGSNRLLERVLEAFENSVSRLQPMLVEARDNHDLATIGQVAHTLKSSSASIGAIKLSRLCAEIEQMIRQSSEDALGPRIDAVCDEIGLVIDNLRSMQSQK